MYYLSKILIGILPWVPWLPRCGMNLVRSCQDSQDATKRVNLGGFNVKNNRISIFSNREISNNERNRGEKSSNKWNRTREETPKFQR